MDVSNHSDPRAASHSLTASATISRDYERGGLHKAYLTFKSRTYTLGSIDMGETKTLRTNTTTKISYFKGTKERYNMS